MNEILTLCTIPGSLINQINDVIGNDLKLNIENEDSISSILVNSSLLKVRVPKFFSSLEISNNEAKITKMVIEKFIFFFLYLLEIGNGSSIVKLYI